MEGGLVLKIIKLERTKNDREHIKYVERIRRDYYSLNKTKRSANITMQKDKITFKFHYYLHKSKKSFSAITTKKIEWKN